MAERLLRMFGMNQREARRLCRGPLPTPPEL
jgi:hypothetical protein